jgi:hypothetical protein
MKGGSISKRCPTSGSFPTSSGSSGNYTRVFPNFSSHFYFSFDFLIQNYKTQTKFNEKAMPEFSQAFHGKVAVEGVAEFPIQLCAPDSLHLMIKKKKYYSIYLFAKNFKFISFN